MQCYNCGAEVQVDGKPERSSECPACMRPLRCCKNCEFYAPGAHWDCRETVPEQVLDKERANFCDYFRARAVTTGRVAKKQTSSRADFDALFS